MMMIILQPRTLEQREQLQQVIVGLSVTSRACSMKKTMELNFFLQLLGYFNISQLQSSKACPFENEILLVIEFYERVRRQLIMGSLQLQCVPFTRSRCLRRITEKLRIVQKFISSHLIRILCLICMMNTIITFDAQNGRNLEKYIIHSGCTGYGRSRESSSYHP